ncbi:hypothetical protein CMETHOX_11510 [Lacrimispora indolis]|nr:hypothetical protein CMETHOX_11510 [[Clostridium] methoxybenzovorans]
MSNNQNTAKNVAMLNHLIDLTKSDQIIWNFLDKNPDLIKKAQVFNESNINMDDPITAIDRKSSFYFKISNSYVMVYVPASNFMSQPIFKIISDSEVYTNELCLKDVSYVSLLTQLLNVIKSKYEDPDEIVDAILRMPVKK